MRPTDSEEVDLSGAWEAGRMWLGWQPALALAIVLATIGLSTRRPTDRRAPGTAALGAVSREAALVFALYAVWQYAAGLRTTRLADGLANGRTVLDLERVLHIANEGDMARWLVEHPTLARAANLFYAGLHVPALIVFLIWLFFRHRDRYRPLRNTVAATTGTCLVLHFVAVAPPRMYPDLGFVDVAVTYGQSVYGPVGQGLSDQVSALPSLHAAWAIIIAYGVVTVSTSRYRWWILAHPVLTMLIIAATANHWWLDSIAAAAVIVAVVGAQRTIARLRRDAPHLSAPGEVASEDPSSPTDWPDRRAPVAH